MRPEIQEILQSSEMAGERTVAHVRTLFVLTFTVAMIVLWSNNTPLANVCFASSMGLWCIYAACVYVILLWKRGHHLPWLKYLSITVDIGLVASTAVGTYFNHSGIIEYLRFIPAAYAAWNVMSGLRYDLVACIYGSCLSLVLHGGILAFTVLSGAVELSDESVAGRQAINLGDETLVLMMIASPGLVAGIIARRFRRLVVRASALGVYSLDRRIGRGGMGEVWRASHRLLKREAAVKLIRPERLGADNDEGREEVLRRFELEASVTARLKSVHTVELYDYGVTEGGAFCYYVMELLDGLDLRQMVKWYGPIPPARAVYLLRQACHSLAEAHAQSLVHRDIKPANIHVCRLGPDDDFIKVVDFGLVKPLHKLEWAASPGSRAAEVTEGMTADGSLRCTPGYMAPEMAIAQDRIGPATDIYQLGCVAYWMLTGERVFGFASPLEEIAAHLHSTPEPPSSRVDEPIPEALERLIMRCLQKDPGARPESVLTLLEDLDATGLAAGWNQQLAAEWWDEHDRRATSSELPFLEDTGPLATSKGNATVAIDPER